MGLSKKEIKIISLMALDTVFFGVEITIGYIVNSLALIADSFHMLNDILSLAVALWAVNVAKNKGADAKFTYGWQRAEILGALANGIFLLALCFSIFVEAIGRFITPPVITNPQLILLVGVLGLLSNFVGLALFHDVGDGHNHSHHHDEEAALIPPPVSTSVSNDNHVSAIDLFNSATDDSDIENVMPSVVVNQLNGTANKAKVPLRNKSHKHTQSLNMRGVFLHVLGDCLGNIGVIVTALFIWKTDYSWKYYFDPAVSVFITCIIVSTALPLCKSSSRILLQGAPVSVDSDQVKDAILSIPEVESIHDFHVWNLTESYLISTTHVELNCSPEKFLAVASEIKAQLHSFGIHNATIQPEFSKYYGQVHMLPKGYSASSGNLPGTADESNTSVYSSTGNATERTALTQHTTGEEYGTNGETSTHCIVDAYSGCTPKGCVAH